MTRTIQILELRQRRCANRFGISPCNATGTPKCFQTYATCKDRANFNLNGEMRWYFSRPGDPVVNTAGLGSEPPAPGEDAGTLLLNDRIVKGAFEVTEKFVRGAAMPILDSVSSKPTRINLGAVRETESPFGLRGIIKASLSDFEFRNQFGDYYANEREVRGSIGRLLLAWLGESVSQLEMYLYTGKEGDTLPDMVRQRFDVTNITPPDRGGRWSIEGRDPLDRAMRKKAQFPRPTPLILEADIDDTTTEITVSGTQVDVLDPFGTDGFLYGRLGSEVIRYTGVTGTAPNWTLTGVKRGVLGTQPESHEIDDGFQRVGHYDNALYWEIVKDLFENHTTIPSELIPFNEWSTEGRRWLSTLRGTGTFTEPRPVEEVAALAMRDGLFVLWWDARDQKIKLKALRQPSETPVDLTERGHILVTNLKREPDQRRTRVSIYYDRVDPTEGLNEASNYRTQSSRVDGEAENPFYADGTVRNLTWYSPLMRDETNAQLVQASFLQRYRVSPEYLIVDVAGKDAGIRVGDVVRITSYDVIDSLGNPETSSWEVIEWDEIEPNARYRIMVQSFVLFERPAFIMANDAPDFASATDEDKVQACYITQNDGLMPDGSVGYVIQ